MELNEHQLSEWQVEFADASPDTIIAWAAQQFGSDVAFASALGAEDQVITHLASDVAPGLRIFTLDTGRLFAETYDLIQKTEERYGSKMDIMFPDASEVEEMVKEHGINLFYRAVELRKMCCGIRKIRPLQRAMTGLSAWISGLRREQSVTRSDIGVIEWDSGNGLIKINPLWNWTEDQVWTFIRDHSVPYNALHDKGFPSIGCASCTRAVEPGQDVRSGRWWWEDPEQKECGLHLQDGKLVRARSD